MSKTKTLNQLVKMVCEIEAGKTQINSGNCREVLKVIAFLVQTSHEFDYLFYHYCNDLFEKKAKKKK